MKNNLTKILAIYQWSIFKFFPFLIIPTHLSL